MSRMNGLVNDNGTNIFVTDLAPGTVIPSVSEKIIQDRNC
jgi:hypothetical protein